MHTLRSNQCCTRWATEQVYYIRKDAYAAYVTQTSQCISTQHLYCARSYMKLCLYCRIYYVSFLTELECRSCTAFPVGYAFLLTTLQMFSACTWTTIYFSIHDSCRNVLIFRAVAHAWPNWGGTKALLSHMPYIWTKKSQIQNLQ